jgi:ribosomal protein S18 acetylase RimI-like enzyme
VTSAVRLREAGPADADSVGLLHADSWRRHYRGSFADAFLDGDLTTDRRSVWADRLAAPGNTLTLLAEDETGLVGFGHVLFDDDARWGSLIDNLHVAHDRHRGGVGRALLVRIAEAVAERAVGASMYLWVLERNTAAQRFYRACGGRVVERAPVPPPGGDPTRLDGSPVGLRVAWPDASALATTG